MFFFLFFQREGAFLGERGQTGIYYACPFILGDHSRFLLIDFHETLNRMNQY